MVFHKVLFWVRYCFHSIQHHLVKLFAFTRILNSIFMQMILSYTSISPIRMLLRLSPSLYDVQEWMSLSKLKLNPEKTEFIVFGSKAQRQKISSDFPVSILGSLLHPVDSVRNLGVWFDADFHSLSISRGLAKHASFRCVTSIELESISLLKWQSLLQMPWLVVIWTIVTLCSEVCPVSISTNCKVFRTPLLVLLQIIESMLMLHPFYRNSTGCLLSTDVFSKPQHLCINFCIVVLLLISNRSCLLVLVPIVLGIVTQIVNTLQFLNLNTQSADTELVHGH